ncbi:hypothetical protein [Sphingomonas sp.]|uniref:hypothetical protein n=1 Tax=Sphingomonas sp. TaxID=28214 RepID=UPI00286D85B7|nr:hypothetical protein [Sphingomonas sp.]
MGTGRAQRAFEAAISAIAAACLAAAVAFAAFKIGGQGQRAMAAAAAGFVVVFFAARHLLARIGSEPRALPLPDFVPAELGPGWAAFPDELLLTAEMAVIAPAPAPLPADDALVLDDILTELAPESRVVQLFEPAAMPTAGELQAHIERHLHNGPPHSPPDASADLHAALEVLRRSLR